MSGLGFKRRRGFTLVEVMLAMVAGTSLLISMTYTSREIKRAVDTAYNESMLQTLARDLNENLEKRMPLVLGEMAFTNETVDMPADGGGSASIQLVRLAHGPYAVGALSVGLVNRAEAWRPAPPAKTPKPGTATPTPTPTPTPRPTATPTATPTPVVSSTPTPVVSSTPTPSPSASSTPISEATPTPTPSPNDEDPGDGEAVVAPTYIADEPEVMPEEAPEIPETDNADNQTMQLGNFAVRFEEGTKGGSLKFTKSDGTWWPMLDLGDRGMIADSDFAFGGWIPPTVNDADTDNLRYDMDQAAWKKLITMTTKLAKDDMLPFYVQSAWAPRNTWQWIKDTIADMGDPPTGWTEPPTAANFPDTGGLFPAAVPKSQMTTGGFDEGWSLDVLNGEGTGSFGWVAFPPSQNNVTLVNELENPETITFYDPVTRVSGGMVDIGSTVQTLTGNHGDNWETPIAEMVTTGKIVTTMVYDQTSGNGGNRTFHIAGFAKWQLVDTTQVDLSECIDCDGNSNYLKFIGYSDEDGNLMPWGYTPW